MGPLLGAGGGATDVGEGGHLEVLQWAREHDCHWNEWNGGCASLRTDAWRSRLEVLKWVREHGCFFVTAVTREPFLYHSFMYLCFSGASFICVSR